MSSNQIPSALQPKEEDIQKLLACQVHLGTKNLDPSMGRYVWKRRSDGVHIINLQKTWEKLIFAARIIAAVEHPQDIVVISGSKYGQRAVHKFAQFIGANSLAGRYTPGTFTNQIQAKFLEPRLLIITDPRIDHQPLKESSYGNIPTISFANTDNKLTCVDVAIPMNNKGEHSLGLMWWFLAREVLYLKNQVPRAQGWDVMPDLFFYRDPKKEEADEANSFAAQTDAPVNAEQNWDSTTNEGWVAQQDGADNWSNTAVPSSNWEGEAQQQ